MKRVGLLGGSFNPAHRGHRKLSLAAMRALDLDCVRWLVSPGNPLKHGEAMAPFEARLGSARAVAEGTAIEVSDFERTAGTRYTIDTVRALIEAFPDERFIWLMGMDTLPNFHRWKAWQELAGLVPIAVLPRPGYDQSARAACAMGWLEGFVRPPGQAKQWTQWSPPAIVFLRLPTDPTSATQLRALDPNWHRHADASAATADRQGETPHRRRPLARSPE